MSARLAPEAAVTATGLVALRGPLSRLSVSVVNPPAAGGVAVTVKLPGGRLVTVQIPLAPVVVVNGTSSPLVTPSGPSHTTVTVAPTMPGSPGSWKPSPSMSRHTQLPRVAGSNSPKL